MSTPDPDDLKRALWERFLATPVVHVDTTTGIRHLGFRQREDPRIILARCGRRTVMVNPNKRYSGTSTHCPGCFRVEGE
jgi:hypothetical protein